MAASDHGCKGVRLPLACGMAILVAAGCGGTQGTGLPRKGAAASAEESATKQANNAQALLAIPPVTPKPSARDRKAEEAAALAIEKLDGRVHTEGPDKIVTKVDLSRKAVTDIDLAHLKVFSQLQELNLHAPDITDAGLQYLQGLTNLRVLDLNFTSISGPGLVHLRAMSQLKELDLGFSHIQDAGLEYLESLTQLQALNLKLTAVSDSGLEHLKLLKNLQQLDVRLTKVTAAGIKGLKQVLPRLQVEY